MSVCVCVCVGGGGGGGGGGACVCVRVCVRVRVCACVCRRMMYLSLVFRPLGPRLDVASFSPSRSPHTHTPCSSYVRLEILITGSHGRHQSFEQR